MRPVILDLDMEGDDALAIMLALRSPELDLMGISVVAGDVPLEVGTQSALQVLELLGRIEIPVYVGAEHPLGSARAGHREVHGPAGLGEAVLPDPEMLPAGDAVELLIDGIQARPGEVIIVAGGPLTNLALAERHKPGILNRARRIFVMGGVLQGEETGGPEAEGDFFADTHAARQVLGSGANITVLPLDVAQQVRFAASIVRKVTEGRSDPLARFFKEVSRTVHSDDEEHPGYSGLFLHNSLAVALAFEPRLCELEMLWLDVEASSLTGKAVVDRRSDVPDSQRQGCQVECAVAVDTRRFLSIFLRRITDVDE